MGALESLVFKNSSMGGFATQEIDLSGAEITPEHWTV